MLNRKDCKLRQTILKHKEKSKKKSKKLLRRLEFKLIKKPKSKDCKLKNKRD